MDLKVPAYKIFVLTSSWLEQKLNGMKFFGIWVVLLLATTAFSADIKKPFGELKEEQKFNDYVVKVYRNEQPPPPHDNLPEHQDGFGCFEILRSGKQVYFQTGFMFEVGGIHVTANSNGLVEMGRSITGNSQPNLVVAEWTGGAHCCYKLNLFEIGKQFRLIDTIDLRNDDTPQFQDLRKDGSFEIVTVDWTFEYWNASFADSHAPKLILRYQGKYRPDLELMKKPVPTIKELENEAEKIRPLFISDQVVADPNNELRVPAKLWGRMLDLIYTGNMDSAWKLCDLSWPEKHPGKAKFLEEFKKRLSTSPFYKDIIKLNGGD